MTFDLVRPVPVAPLRTAARIRREGKRIQLVESVILGGPDQDEEVAVASVLRLRTGESADVAAASAPDLPSPPPWHGDDARTSWFASKGLDERMVPAYLRSLELSPSHPHAVWFRLPRPVVAGHPTPPSVLVAAFADFASGVGQRLDIGALIAVNPDVSVQVFREPESEWIAVESTAYYAADSVGQTAARMFDRRGYIGTASTALLVDRST
jgi:hypothetical protein